MHTTLNEIKEYSAYNDNIKRILKFLGKDKCDDEPLLFSTIYKVNGFEDTAWCLYAIKSHNKELRKLACDFALAVKDLWVMPAIVEEYLTTQNESIREETLTVAIVARAATYAVYVAATTAARTAAYAADAAADAARTATNAALAATNAGYAAHYAAAVCADAAAAGTGLQLKLEKILTDFIAEMEVENEK